MNSVTVEAIYTEYYKKVSCFVAKKVGDYDAAEDIVSDVFLKVAGNIERYDPKKAALSTWIYTIANNTVLDYYRTRKVHGQIPEENGENGQMPENLVDFDELDSGLLAGEQLEELANALLKLPQRMRDIIILHYYGNITLKETAVRLGMSYANIKLVHKKAIMQLQGMLV